MDENNNNNLNYDNNNQQINNNQTLGQMINQPISNNQQPIPNSQNLINNNQPLEQDFNQLPKNVNDEMDDSFAIPKKKPIGLIIIILLLLIIIGGLAYYYFVLDNPKTIFTTVTNNVLDKIKFDDNNKNMTIDYNLSLNLTSPNKELKDTLDLINKIKLSGTFSKENDNNYLNGIVNYQDKQLLDYNVLIDKIAIYAKLNNLYDKTIKLELDDSDDTTYDTNVNDYKQVTLSLKNVLTSSLENANYQKKYVKLNNDTVKKMTLNIDESFIVNICNKLLQDNAFINSYAKIKDMTNEEVSDLLNKDITDAKGNNETLNVYLSVLKNEFIKMEYINDKDTLTVIKDNDKYNFDLSESYTSIYQGYIKLIQVNNKNNLTLSLSLIKDEVNIDANIEYLYDENKKITPFDTTNAVNYDDLSEEETNKITENLIKNEAFNAFLEDYSKLMPDDNQDLVFSSDI